MKRLGRSLRPIIRAARGTAGRPRPAAEGATDALPRGWSAADIARYRPLDAPHLVEIPPIEVVPELSAAPCLTILMPHLAMARMTGGPNTVLNLAGRVAGLGIPVRFAAVAGPTDGDLEPLRRHIERLSETPLLAGSVTFAAAGPGDGPLRVGSRDVVVATWWPTAHVARAVLERIDTREFIYLVQDYEPGFYPWSAEYALAAATYGFAARAVVNERFLLDHLVAERAGIFAEGADRHGVISFEPSVDRELFHLEAAPRPRRRLLFYARPRNKRNLFDLGLRALRDVASQGALAGDRWEVVAIGSPMPPLELAPGVTMVPSEWLDYPAYAARLRASDLLLCLMLSPHTSYPPLEMAACGRLVVTNVFGPKTAAALAAISPSIRASAAEPTALADTLAEAIRDAERLEPVADLRAPASWAEAFADVLPWFRSAIGEIGGW